MYKKTIIIIIYRISERSEFHLSSDVYNHSSLWLSIEYETGKTIGCFSKKKLIIGD